MLATNVAETSLTVPNIGYVIDTGLARVARYSYRSKLQRLPIEPISQASANQRAGRCGRLAPGVCYRLFDEGDFQARPEFTDAEIRRVNLASVVLQMQAFGLGTFIASPLLIRQSLRRLRMRSDCWKSCGHRGRQVNELGPEDGADASGSAVGCDVAGI